MKNTVKLHDKNRPPLLPSKLSKELQHRVSALLQKKWEWMDAPELHQADAKKRFHTNPMPLPRAKIAWQDDLFYDESQVREAIVLTSKQEKELFLRMNWYRMLITQAVEDARTKNRLTLKQIQHLLDLEDEIQDLRSHAVEANMPLVRSMSKRANLNPLDREELSAHGLMALLNAVDKFNISRGFKFSTYACRAILAAFARQGAKMTRHRKVQGARINPEIDSLREAYWNQEPERNAWKETIHNVLDKNKADLTPEEDSVIRARFNLDGRSLVGTQPTLEVVGQRLGMTRESVRRAEKRALKKLHEQMSPMIA